MPSTQDFFFVLQWWFPMFALGLIFLPLTSAIFDKFYDKGYLFSKVIGIALVSYALFALNVFRILPFNLITILLIIWIFFLLNLRFMRWKETLKTLRSGWKILVFEELLFLSGIVVWAYVRAHEPSINGLEKFMDFGFLNSILRSTYQPAVDMWFPPYPINYYYFGHFTTAVLTKLSFLPSYITYNLMIASLFSFTLTLSFSLGMNLLSKIVSLRKAIIGGLLTGLIVALAGNIHTIYTFFVAYNVDSPAPFWNLQFSPFSFPNGYWYPNATRFIPFTIHEFPIYSFVVSDLHGHVVDIIFVLLTIALLFSIITTFKSQISNPKSYIGNWKFEIRNLILLGLILAIMYMTNAWDGIIYMMLAAFVFIFLRKPKFIIPLFFLFVVFSLPFSLNFKPFAQGIGIICAPQFLENIGKIGPFLFEKDHCQRSTWWQLLMLYGFFYFFVLSFISFIVIQRKKIKFLLADIFILLLILISTILIVVPELIYLKDIYPAHYRANTMFKLVYQSFIMLSISSGYIIVRIASTIKPRVFKIPALRAGRFNIYYARLAKRVYLLWTILFLILVFIYPYFAIKSYYGDLKNYQGLNGISYLKQRLPEDYEAINWINKNIKGRPVIVEAQGDSYTDYARISANTGLPTILGWTVHEWLWRGSYDIPAPRIEEVRLIYESGDLAQTRKILNKYNVEYIYVGKLEHEKYQNINDEKFNKLGQIIFQSGQTKIYKINS